MFTSFFRVALRVLWRQKGYTVINIGGLAISMGSALLILLYVLNELQYDTFHTNAKNIYRMYLDGKIGEDRLCVAKTCPPLGPTMKRDYPEVVDFVRIKDESNVLIRTDKQTFLENQILYADSGFFTMFTFPLIRGKPENVLSAPNSMVITSSTASRIFGSADPIGKMIRFENDTSYYMVTGVASDPPQNSQIRFNIVIPFGSVKDKGLDKWVNNSYYTYVRLVDGFPARNLEEKLPGMLLRYIGDEIRMLTGVELKDWTKAGNFIGYKLQPLLDVHLDSYVQGGLTPIANRKYLVIFSLIALFTVLIACINYINIATARSASRAREVGIRKVAGSNRKMLAVQFLSESVLISIISMVIAITLVDLAIPWFNNMMHLSINLKLLWKFPWWAVLIISTVLFGILAGLYPSFLLTTYTPGRVLKSGFSQGKGSALLRKILVTSQFIISIAILIGTIIIYQQLKYMQSKDLGFDKENLLVIERGFSGKNQKFLLDEIKKHPGVINVTISTSIPGKLNNNMTYGIEGRERTNSYLMRTFWTDDNFDETYKLRLLEGRYLSSDFASDSSAAVINAMAMKQCGIDDISKTRFLFPDLHGNYKFYQVVGVVRDFNIESLHSAIKPCIFLLQPNRWNWGYVTVRVKPGEIKQTVDSLVSLWNKFSVDDPLHYFFLDDELNNAYQEEKRTGNLALFFTILSISIACLGLLGLVSYTIVRRTKEISVRKIMGSEPWAIVMMLASETMVLIGIASLIAWPSAWFYMKNWLTNFAFRIQLDPLVFIFATLAVIIISFATIFWQVFKASARNPADALRYE
ncbi:MAG TPA: ABC transporter permease [Bacteroidales bacterium]|nr:ABC transporter permease [Bacteroidales bacterium]